MARAQSSVFAVVAIVMLAGCGEAAIADLSAQAGEICLGDESACAIENAEKALEQFRAMRAQAASSPSVECGRVNSAGAESEVENPGEQCRQRILESMDSSIATLEQQLVLLRHQAGASER